MGEIEEPACLTAGSRYQIEHESGTALEVADPLDWYEIESDPDDFEVPEVLRLGVRFWPGAIGARLDRLTITGQIPNELMEHFSQWSRFNPLFTGEYRAKPPYTWSCNVGAGGLFQCAGARDVPKNWGTRGVFVRYDFNPDKVELLEVAPLLGWFYEARVTRVDVAIDYPRDLCDVAWSRPGTSCSEYRGADGRRESIYFGKSGSRLRFNCYDKSRERESAGEIVPLLPWWRAEARHRPHVEDEVLPEALFDTLDAREPALNMGGKWKDLAAISYCREHPEFVKRLHHRHRAQANEGVRDCFPELDPAPHAVYRAHLERLRDDLTGYLDCCQSVLAQVGGAKDWQGPRLPLRSEGGAA